MPTHPSKIIKNQIAVYEKRLNTVNLTWCNQVIDFIQNYKINSINDIGCNYFQFYKEIKRQNIENCYDYFGYDIDEHFIKLGLKYFPELDDRFQVSNVEEVMPRNGHV